MNLVTRSKTASLPRREYNHTQNVLPRRRALGCVLMRALDELPRRRAQGDAAAHDQHACQRQVRSCAAIGAAARYGRLGPSLIVLDLTEVYSPTHGETSEWESAATLQRRFGHLGPSWSVLDLAGVYNTYPPMVQRRRWRRGPS